MKRLDLAIKNMEEMFSVCQSHDFLNNHLKGVKLIMIDYTGSGTGVLSEILYLAKIKNEDGYHILKQSLHRFARILYSGKDLNVLLKTDLLGYTESDGYLSEKIL